VEKQAYHQQLFLLFVCIVMRDCVGQKSLDRDAFGSLASYPSSACCVGEGVSEEAKLHLLTRNRNLGSEGFLGKRKHARKTNTR
jgi:hypothetical protein